MVPGFALSTLAIVVMSLLDKPPSARQQAIHEEVDLTIAEHGG